MEEKIFQIIRKNININDINYIDNIDYLTCQNCAQLKFKAKICKKCNKSLCFFCQKNHNCFTYPNNSENWEIDNFSRELIKNIKVICPKCRNEFEYFKAPNHIQICFLQGEVYLNLNTIYSNGNNISRLPTSEHRIIITNNDSKKESSSSLCCIFKNCNCYSCDFCKCSQCECKPCNCNCQFSDGESLCDKIKDCFENLTNKNIKFSILFFSILKLILGYVFSGIVLSNIPSYTDYVDKISDWEGERDEMKNVGNKDFTIAVLYFVFCTFSTFAGFLFICLSKLKVYLYLQFILFNLPDFIFGDLILTVSIPSHRKRIINNLETYPNQKLIHILNDAYNKIYSSQWAIFSIKMILLFFIIILFIRYIIIISNTSN